MPEIVSRKQLNSFIKNELFYDEEFFNKLLNILISEFNKLKVDNSIGAGLNFDALATAAHKLKSSCKSFGATYLSQQLQDLEQAAKSKNVSQAHDLYMGLLKCSDQTFEEIRSFSTTIFAEGKKSA